MSRKHFKYLAESLRLARPWNKSYPTYAGEMVMWKQWRKEIISYCKQFDASQGFDKQRFIAATEE